MAEGKDNKIRRSPLKILVVEDSDFLRDIFKTALANEHLVEAAPNVKQGWDLYLKGAPDVVFLDIMLPDGSGHDLAHRMKRQNPKIHIIMATASDYTDDIEEAAFNHVDGFLTKPFGKQKIDEVIDRFWTGRR
jgi:CheY-like chemotaxis protein